MSPGPPNTPGEEPESLSAAEQRLFHLQRQLDIETKVRQGAENMLSQFSGTKDKKLLVEAEELLQDSKERLRIYFNYDSNIFQRTTFFPSVNAICFGTKGH